MSRFSWPSVKQYENVVESKQKGMSTRVGSSGGQSSLCRDGELGLWNARWCRNRFRAEIKGPYIGKEM